MDANCASDRLDTNRPSYRWLLPEIAWNTGSTCRKSPGIPLALVGNRLEYRKHSSEIASTDLSCAH
ncbi:unnamed protein product [Prunus armeniaca]